RQGRGLCDPGHRRGAGQRGPRLGDQRRRAAARRGDRGAARGRCAAAPVRFRDAGMTIAERWHAVTAHVAAACERAGRPPGSVTIVAVSKTRPAEAIRQACAAGATDFGENYAQELVAKAAELAAAPTGVRWHFIGRLQRNKARLIAGRVALVHAVDSVDLAAELARRAGGAVQPILLAVNLGGEASKG